MSIAANVQTTCHDAPADAWADAAAWNAIAGGVPFRTTDWLEPWVGGRSERTIKRASWWSIATVS